MERKTGDFITGLPIQDFEIYDNDRPQKITGDFRDSPFSLVVAVQRSADMAGMLSKIQKIGSVLTDVIVGLDGEVAVVGFDHGVQVMQDFTGDSDKVDRAMRNLKPGSYSHAAIDAVRESVRMLKNRPHERRRIVLVIAESWDKGSEASLRDALTEAEFANITVYALVVSTAAAELTSEPKPQPRAPFPTTAYNIPAVAPLTPTTLGQNYYLGNWVPLLINVFQSVENVFTDNTLDAFTRFTGGEGFSLDSDRTLDKGLEEAQPGTSCPVCCGLARCRMRSSPVPESCSGRQKESATRRSQAVYSGLKQRSGNGAAVSSSGVCRVCTMNCAPAVRARSKRNRLRPC